MAGLTPDRGLAFHRASSTRPSSARVLPDEFGADDAPRPLDTEAGRQREPAFPAVNPMGKAPSVLHRGALAAEQAAARAAGPA